LRVETSRSPGGCHADACTAGLGAKVCRRQDRWRATVVTCFHARQWGSAFQSTGLADPAPELEMASVSLDGRSLTARQVVAVAREGGRVSIDPGVRARMAAMRTYITATWMTDGAPWMYGFNTGVGALKATRIAPSAAAEFQRNLIFAHSGGTGDPMPLEVVRAMMLLRANALAANFSGVRVAVVERLLDMLNHEITPVVAAQGSVGASGDLAPLAIMSGAMMGLAQCDVVHQGVRVRAPDAFAREGLAPEMAFEAKEASALINGSTASLAYAVLAAWDSRRLLEHASVSLALSLEALRCELSAYDERVQAARPHPGQCRIAAGVLAIVAGTQRCTEAARPPGDPPRIQDAYSLRCAPQVHGPVLDALDYIDGTLATEMNSATDNPLIVEHPAGGLEVISCGHFHGQYIAQAMDLLAMAVTDLTAICDRRAARLVDPACNFGLPLGLIAHQPGINSGLSSLQSTGTALVLECMGLAHNASVMSLPAKGNSEDHISNSCWAARRTRQVIANAQAVVAIELMLAAQALDLADRDLAGHPVGAGSAAAWRVARQAVPAAMSGDRWVASDLAAMRMLVEQHTIVTAVEALLQRAVF
jgi:histidine ammonia-lyase